MGGRAIVADAATRPERPFWRDLRAWIGGLGLVLYAVAVWLDWPPAAGLKYAPPPAGAGQHPAGWWEAAQALRGWGVYPAGWEWPLIAPAPLARWLPILGLGLLGGGALWIAARRAARAPGRIPVGALAGLVLLGFGLQLAALWLKHPNAEQLLLDRITSRSFTGYFTSATRIADPATFFGGYADAIAATAPDVRLCGHCRTHPPGPILAYWLPLQTLRALPPAWQAGLGAALVDITNITPPDLLPAEIVLALLAAHVILLGGALIVVPLYGLARRLAGPEPALPLAALGVVLPGLLLMSPEFDQLFGTAAAGLFYLALRGLGACRRHVVWGLGAGLALAGCLYWSFGLAVLGGVLVALAGAAVLGRLPTQAMPGRLPLRAGAAWLGGLALGTAIPWALLWGLGGFDLPRVLAITQDVHLQGITVLRPYGPWAVFDLVDFLQFVGLPLTAATLLTLVGRGGINFLGLVFWGVVLALDLSGTARAEVGRLWIFLLPLALLAVYVAAGHGRPGRQGIAALLVAQFAVCVLLGGRWLTP